MAKNNRGIRYPQEFKKKIIDLYVSGRSSKELFREYGIDPQTTLNWVVGSGNTVRPYHPRYSEEFKNKIVSLCASGAPILKLKKEYNVTVPTIYAWAKKSGVSFRPVSRIISQDGKEKVCSRCYIMKPLECFNKKSGSKIGFSSMCKECRKNSERVKKYKRSPADFNNLLESQNGVCGICESSGNQEWHVDHDHSCCPGEETCGKCVRGLICSSCNLGLGFFKDNQEILQKAIRYLQKYYLQSKVTQETRRGGS